MKNKKKSAAQLLGSRGGKASAASMTAAERSARAKKAVDARIAKYKIK